MRPSTRQAPARTHLPARRGPALAFALLLAAAPACAAAEPRPAPGAVTVVGPVALEGPLIEPTDLSAVLAVGERLLVASDEASSLQWLAPRSDGQGYAVDGAPLVLLGDGTEADIEGLALDGSSVLALASHARVRPRLASDERVAHNRRDLTTIRRHPLRDRLFRLPLDESGRLAGPPTWLDLRERIRADSLLAPFGEIPSKENGVDLEAIAAGGDTVWVGCRSPILRSGHVPVLVLSLAHPDRHELRVVDLGGRGIAEMIRLDEGLLLLASREEGDAALYLWDGRDDVPGRDAPASPVVRLGSLDTPEGGRAEGMALLRREGRTLELLVVHDGLERGAARRVRVTLPAQAGPGLR